MMFDWFKKLVEVKRAASIKPAPVPVQKEEAPKQTRKVRAIGDKAPVKKTTKGKGIKRK